MLWDPTAEPESEEEVEEERAAVAKDDDEVPDGEGASSCASTAAP